MKCTPIALVALLASCTSYYLTSNTNNWKMGQTKQSFLAAYPQQNCGAHLFVCRGMEMRAARQQPDGSLLEVATLTLSRDGSASDPVEYWLLFRNGTLVQYGRPEDWQSVSARYDINFNPAPAVRP